MKKCPKCKEQKALFLFHKDIRRKDGLGGICKRCHNDLCIAGKKKKPEKYAEYMREYRKNYVAPYKAIHPNWEQAAFKVKRAVKSGALQQLPCKQCGDNKTNAHHPFYRYFEPLTVVWLCAKHHKEAHAEEKATIENKAKFKIMHKNQQMERIEGSISFYLKYHHIPEIVSTRILGNLLMVFQRELKG